MVLLGLGALKGYQKGLVVEVLSFLAFFIGFYLALKLTIPVTGMLFGSSDKFHIALLVVFVSLLILLIIGVKIVARLIKSAINVTLFGTFDNMLGAIAGILKWAFVLSVIFWVFNSVNIDIVERYADHTVIFPYIEDIGPGAFELMGYLFPFFQVLIDDLRNLPNQKVTYVTFFHILCLNN